MCSRRVLSTAKTDHIHLNSTEQNSPVKASHSRCWSDFLLHSQGLVWKYQKGLGNRLSSCRIQSVFGCHRHRPTDSHLRDAARRGKEGGCREAGGGEEQAMLSCLTCDSSLPRAVTGCHIGAPGMWPPAPPSKPSGPALASRSPSGNPDPIREPGSQLRGHIAQPSSGGQQPAHDNAPSDPVCSRKSIHKPLPPDLVLYFLMLPYRNRSVVPHQQTSASLNM